MSSFTPRLTAPAANDPLWVMTAAGGYNGCIAGSYPGGISNYPCVLPNCTGYVHGRAMEIAGVTTDNLGLSFGNAYDYWTGSSSDWIQDSEPSLGAIAVYETMTGYGPLAPYPGHVAVVEQIIDADTVVVSESNWEISYFDTKTLTRSGGWDPYPGEYVALIGFLRNPYVVTTNPDAAKFAILMLAKKRKEEKNVIKRYSGII